MSSVFKPTYNRPIPPGAKRCKLNGKPAVRYTDGRGRVHNRPLSADGKRMICRQSRWWMRYRLPDGTERRSKGFTDKSSTEQEAARRERGAAAAAAGLALVDDKHLSAPFMDHLKSYLDDLERAGRCAKYCELQKTRLQNMMTKCGWLTLGLINPQSLAGFLVGMNRQGAAAKTINEYISSAKSFLNWCVRQRRLAANPLAHVTRTKEIEKKYQRRALTLEEAKRLLSVAGPRRLVYLTAMRTGLRRSELKELCWGDLRIDPLELRPHIVLRARATKGRRGDIIALRKNLAAELLAVRPENVDPSAKVFKRVAAMDTFKRDLERAGIERMDSSGRVVDFHALRYTLGTMLAQTGTAPRTAMEIMRHKDIKLTMNVYTDPRLLDTTAAIEQLPDLNSPAGTERAVGLRTGTDDAPVSHSKKVLTKSTSLPVSLGRSVAQSVPESENTDSQASQHLAAVTSCQYRDKDQQQRTLPASPRPQEQVDVAGSNPAGDALGLSDRASADHPGQLESEAKMLRGANCCAKQTGSQSHRSRIIRGLSQRQTFLKTPVLPSVRSPTWPDA